MTYPGLENLYHLVMPGPDLASFHSVMPGLTRASLIHLLGLGREPGSRLMNEFMPPHLPSGGGVRLIL